MIRPAQGCPTCGLAPNAPVRRPPFVPEDCIASVPPQCAQSCEAIMGSLIAGLDDLVGILHRLVEIHFADEPELVEDILDEMAPAEELLMDMLLVWPHLAGHMGTEEPQQETLDFGAPGALKPRG